MNLNLAQKSVGGTFHRWLRGSSLAVVALNSLPSTAAEITGRAQVIDGDTLAIGPTKIRLYGIDAPESRQACQSALGRDYDCSGLATHALRALVEGQAVTCEARDLDQYGRTVAVCHVAARDLGGFLVEQGHALAFRRYSLDYVKQEDHARVAKRGMWSGRFQPAWEWRAARRASLDHQALTQVAPRARCTIKGNINRKGAHIYHVEGSRDYARTQIIIVSGERWFCSESEARNAGWRASKGQ